MSKVTLQFVMETETVLFGTNAKEDKMAKNSVNKDSLGKLEHMVPLSVGVQSGKQKAC